MQLIDRDIAKSSALVIDANPTARGLLAAQLRDFGVGAIVQCARIQEARRQLESRTFDIVLCEQEFEAEGYSGQNLLDDLRKQAERFGAELVPDDVVEVAAVAGDDLPEEPVEELSELTAAACAGLFGDGTSFSRPVEIRRLDGSLAELMTFGPHSRQDVSATELASLPASVAGPLGEAVSARRLTACLSSRFSERAICMIARAIARSSALLHTSVTKERSILRAFSGKR